MYRRRCNYKGIGSSILQTQQKRELAIACIFVLNSIFQIHIYIRGRLICVAANKLDVPYASFSSCDCLCVCILLLFSNVHQTYTFI